MTPLVCGERCLVRTWVTSGRDVNQRATAIDFIAGPLSVTNTTGVISLVSASTLPVVDGRVTNETALVDVDLTRFAAGEFLGLSVDEASAIYEREAALIAE